MAYLDIATWQSLGDVQYRTLAVYESMAWGADLSLEDFVVAAAPFGGPIALAKDMSRLQRFDKGNSSIAIYSAAGHLMGRAPMQAGQRLVFLGWDASEHLLAAYENGVVDAFSVRGEAATDRSFALLPALTDERIEAVVVAGSALAALGRPNDGDGDGPVDVNLYLVYDLAKPTPTAARDTGLPSGATPTVFAAIDGAWTSHGRMEVLLGVAEPPSLVVVRSDTEAEDQQLDAVLTAPPKMLAVSPQGKYLAVLCEDGVLAVLDAAFERKLVEFETKATAFPDQLVWCGKDAVAIRWGGASGDGDLDDGAGGAADGSRGGTLLVGPFCDYLRIPHEEATVLVGEVDALRLVSAGGCTLLQAVPAPLVAIRSIGSTRPGALLLDAAALFDAEDAKCDELIRTLQADADAEGGLFAAVGQCIAGALAEWDPAHQRTLLHAASYGKAFDADIDAAPFVAACKKLRCMNALRAADVGVPLTSEQWDALTAPVVADRLLARHAHRLALHVADYLRLPRERGRDRILVHWACAKVRASTSLTDDAIAALVRAKLAGVASVSYADIAATADSAGRRALATILLGYEPRVADQVPILLKMREGALALERALGSGDADLIGFVLVALRDAIRKTGPSAVGSTAVAAASGAAAAAVAASAAAAAAADDNDADGTFLRVVLAHPAAVDVLAAYARAADPPLLRRLLLAAGRFVDAGLLDVRDAYARDDLKARVALLRRAAEIMRDGERVARSGGERAAAGFWRGSIEEQVALLTAQARLEADFEARPPPAATAAAAAAAGGTGGVYVDLPLTETLFNMLLLTDGKGAAALARDFKLSDALLWHAKVRGLARLRDWPALLAFSNERKPPIGYRPFAEACMAEGATVEARKYAARLPDYGEKVDLLIELGAYNDAAELAAKAKDGERLAAIAASATTSSAKEFAEKALAALNK